jgi:hypothetical protein
MVFEIVGGVDENNHRLSGNPTTKLSNVKNINLQCDSDLVENDELHLAGITTQAHKWKPNNRNSICWGFFAINDNFPIDFRDAAIYHLSTNSIISW